MTKKIFFYFTMLTIMLCLVEFSSFVLVQLIDQGDFFDSRDVVLARLSEDGLAKFKLKSGTAVTGWGWRGAQVRRTARSVGGYGPVLYTQSPDYTLKPYMAGGTLIPHPGKGASSRW